MDECVGGHVCPECVAGKHGNCRGDAWCLVEDAPTSCDCALAGHPATLDRTASDATA